MSRHPQLYHWTDVVSSHFPHLSKPLAAGLALWSLGMIIARSCSLTAVAGILAPLLAQPFNPVRERLRDTYREAPAKAGAHRVQRELRDCWAPWLAWVLEGWEGRQLALALDATTVGQRVVVLAIRVVYRGCAVPVAWKILPATEKHPWQPEWLALLKHFRGLVAPDWTVIVLADRGLYAKWLFQAIVALGWHPLLRLNQQGQFRPQGWYHGVPFTTLVPTVGRRWQGQGTAFTGKDTQLDCTLLGCWDAGHQAAWRVLTDLPPHTAQVCWYGLRAWIEIFFRLWKSGCRVEALQLGTLERLERALVIDLLIAWRILHLVPWGRDCPEWPCEVVFDPAEWQAAWIVAHRRPPPETPPKLGERVRLIAGFGGFLGRKSDGHPGPKALWEGMQRISAFAMGIEASRAAYTSDG